MARRMALLVFSAVMGPAAGVSCGARDDVSGKSPRHTSVQLGPRPFFLVDQMDEGPLKARLQKCSDGPFEATDFSIGHRGAPLQFPEHTRESYLAAARMGAGLVECDVTFTRDRQLVCRHSQCDLHTTTNILVLPELAAKCTKPFTPADPATGTPASARCCTSDLTLAEFKGLCGKMDGFDPDATTAEQFLKGTPGFRTELYASCGTVLSHRESIGLIDALGVKPTPELKPPEVTMPYEGDYTQEDFAQQLIDEYRAANIAPERVMVRSSQLEDVLYWLRREPAFGRRAAFIDGRVDTPEGYAAAVAGMPELAKSGVRTISAPIFALVELDAQQRIVPSDYAIAARANSLALLAWTLERSGPLGGGGDSYYSSVSAVIDDDGDMLRVLDVLATQVGVRGVLSDWPATVTYYANCTGL